jgi:hypothetical protein
MHRRRSQFEALLRRCCRSGYAAHWLRVAREEGGVICVTPGQFIRRIAVSYMIEALSLDHYSFRVAHETAGAKGQKLHLARPPRTSGDKSWWDDDYTVVHKIKDRELFSQERLGSLADRPSPRSYAKVISLPLPSSWGLTFRSVHRDQSCLGSRTSATVHLHPIFSVPGQRPTSRSSSIRD